MSYKWGAKKCLAKIKSSSGFRLATTTWKLRPNVAGLTHGVVVQSVAIARKMYRGLGTSNAMRLTLKPMMGRVLAPAKSRLKSTTWRASWNKTWTNQNVGWNKTWTKLRRKSGAKNRLKSRGYTPRPIGASPAKSLKSLKKLGHFFWKKMKKVSFVFNDLEQPKNADLSFKINALHVVKIDTFKHWYLPQIASTQFLVLLMLNHMTFSSNLGEAPQNPQCLDCAHLVLVMSECADYLSTASEWYKSIWHEVIHVTEYAF